MENTRFSSHTSICGYPVIGVRLQGEKRRTDPVLQVPYILSDPEPWSKAHFLFCFADQVIRPLWVTLPCLW